MNSTKIVAGKTYRHFMHDSLRRNSSLLILSQAVNAGAAFVFWVICAHLFLTKEVGLAIAFISFGTLVATFTNLGLPNTVIRFLPTSKQKGGLFSSSIYAVLVASVVGSIVALSLISILVPKLGFVSHSLDLSLVLALLIIGSSLSPLLDGTLMAFRKGQYILGKALIINIPRILLPFLLVSWGLKGIISPYSMLIILGIAYNLFIVIRKLVPGESLSPRMNEIRQHTGYALGNYFGGMFGILPTTLVPLIVLSKLGAESAAYIYMPLQIAAFLNIISSSTSQALISEASQVGSLSKRTIHFKNATKHLFSLLIPAIICVAVIGWPVLLVYGKAYAQHGFLPLVVLAGSSAFVAINWLGDTFLNIQKRARAYFMMNGFNAFVVVGFVYIFANKHSLIAVSIGWLLGQVISAMVYLIIFQRARLFSFAVGAKTSS